MVEYCHGFGAMEGGILQMYWRPGGLQLHKKRGGFQVHSRRDVLQIHWRQGIPLAHWEGGGSFICIEAECTSVTFELGRTSGTLGGGAYFRYI